MPATTARMSDKAEAQAYGYRNVDNGEKPMKWSDITLLVKKTDGSHPTAEAGRVAVRDLKENTTTHRKLLRHHA